MSSMTRVTVKKDFPKCAFCKFWHDPDDTYIEPKAPNMDQWAYDSTAKCKCLKNNMMKQAGAGVGCRNYVCKIPLNK